ncbi:hypothetical protein CLPUN_26690 [Clostridium puniceum]|uniref:Uncharacterized protein n=1 Tax=Clostridium puniceum TaxID=29367 RepID=A0A1S8TF49_9CLOT|nr:hypothetical protein [Clostridium puniceum]OOM76437.1 hypothetical protein CLPUN_26690 [Clostridium puniceum]
MSKEKAPYNPTPGDYDVEKLTDIHSSESEPSSYTRNIHKITNFKGPENIYNSSESIKSRNNVDITERIPTLSKYSDMNKDDDEFEYKGEI